MPFLPAQANSLIPAGGMDCLVAIFVFFAFVTPLYLTMRSLVRLTRIRYGFVEPESDDGPPLRVCDACANSVLEPDFQHCPYCGAPLPPADAADGLAIEESGGA